MQTMKERLEEARKRKGAISLKVEYLKFEKPGDAVLGEFVSKTLIEGKEFDGLYCQYVFNTDAGPVKCHMGGAFDQEYAEMLKPGTLYLIEFTGTDDIGHNRVIKRYNVLEVPPVSDR